MNLIYCGKSFYGEGCILGRVRVRTGVALKNDGSARFLF